MAFIPFSHKLVLNRYMLSLFGVDTLDLEMDPFILLAQHMKDETLEGRREDGLSLHYEIVARLIPAGSALDPDVLAEYDANIARHTERLNRKRPIRVQWKYFQYLSLLFTEIYLDRWFREPNGLLNDVNAYLGEFNAMLEDRGEGRKDLVPPFTSDSLRRLSFWSATGSGKTLLLHMNLMQFRDYLQRFRRVGEINRVVVLTPNEQLTRQHLEEFRLSSISAASFDKNRTGDMMSINDVDVIDMNKLRDEGKKKTVSVDQFLGNNLVFIDEGHRGARGDVWYDMRTRLAKDGGFTFEYSATFGQVAGNDAKLAGEYAGNILFDYSYRFFHADGFGKDYSIVNISPDQKREIDSTSRRLYLTACLLTFYQQLRLFADRRERYKPFNLHKPLWVFVGARVTGQESDVVDVLCFLARFIKDQKDSIECLERLLTVDTGLRRKDGSDLFADVYTYLYELGIDGEDLYKDILSHLFNADSSGLLHVELLKGADGELALSAGNSERPFGVINVGDARAVKVLCDKYPDLIKVGERDMAASLFPAISDENSPINVLIGSKRFTEGWNSYRVSTLGLMNMGKKEGSEIIQLFGRGVRLRGFRNCMKRSRTIPWLREDGEMATWVPRDHHLPLLETLHVFGVKADYMDDFNRFLERESIRPDRREELVRIKVQAPAQRLWMIKIVSEKDFKETERPALALPPPDLSSKRKVILDWYPRVVTRDSVRAASRTESMFVPDTAKLGPLHLAFLDLDAVFFALQRHKAERGWHNFNLDRETIRGLLADPSWYTLYIPEERMRPRDFSRVREWQEVAIALLKKYCERYYTYRKEEWEKDYRCFAPLAPDDANFPRDDQYYIYVDRSETLFLHHLKELGQRIEDGVLTDFRLGGKGDAIFFDRHLYSPLIYLKKGVQSDLIRVSPVHLNEGERQFVIDLRDYYNSHPAVLDDCDIYLLRNQTRGKGIGFFEAGNFYPDFILWVQRGDVQHIIFVDPKGIYQCEGIEDPKLRFWRDIKDVEARMLDRFPDMKGRITLDSFIVSNTQLGSVRWWRPDLASEAEFAEFHVLFQNSGDPKYVEAIFLRVIGKSQAIATPRQLATP